MQEAVPEVPDLPVQTPVTGADEADQPEPESTPDRKQKADREPKAASAKSERRGASKEPSAKASASATVTISDFKFTPDTVTVNEGDTVTFNNDGPTVHTATADDGSFDTGSLREGESGSATFTQAGTITYFCQPHPFMKGSVVVQAASCGGQRLRLERRLGQRLDGRQRNRRRGRRRRIEQRLRPPQHRRRCALDRASRDRDARPRPADAPAPRDLGTRGSHASAAVTAAARSRYATKLRTRSSSNSITCAMSPVIVGPPARTATST